MLQIARAGSMSSSWFGHRLPAALALVVMVQVSTVAAADVVVHAARGDWPQWRGNPQQTGYQAMPGRIVVPQVLRSYAIGGALSTHSVLFVDRQDGSRSVIVAPPGSMEAYALDGTRLWSTSGLTHMGLMGAFDFDGDGRSEILTFSPGAGPTWLRMFSAETGELLWSSEPHDGAVGAVKVADLNRDGFLDLIWAPAASSVIRAFTFASGFDQACSLWEHTIDDYTSDPYSASPIVVADLEGDGESEIILTGGRRLVAVMIFEGRTGTLVSRHDYYGDEVAGRLHEGGGAQQLLQVEDLDGDGVLEIAMISAYGSTDPYMFQGLAIIRSPNLQAALFSDRHPVGPRYAFGSVQDFDGDGVADILISEWRPARFDHQLELLDSRTLQPKATADGFLLEGILEDPRGGSPIIVARSASTEYGEATDGLAVLQWSEGEFLTLWTASHADSITTLKQHDPRPWIENAGPLPLAIDVDDDATADLLLDTGKGLEARNLLTGSVVFQYLWPAGKRIGFLKSSDDGKSLFAVYTDGTGALLRSTFAQTGDVAVGGYARLFSTNTHGGAVSVVADLDGDGRNEVYATTSTNDLIRIDTSDPFPNGRLILSSPVPLQPIALSGLQSLLVKACHPLRIDSICRISADGIPSWKAIFPVETGRVVPTSLNVGLARAGQHTIFTSGSAAFPAPVHAFDVSTGSLLWTSEWGTYGDGTFAVWDFDRDGVDDVAFNFNTEKGTVISGADGSILSRPALLPPYGVLGHVDYNGVPVIVDWNGAPAILDVEDNAHVALLRPSRIRGAETEVVWATEQAKVDDERRSMPAVAPDDEVGAILGSGTQRGIFIARNVVTGEELWRRELYAGGFASTEEEHALGGVVAVDVDGRDGVDFVVGGDDGFLYALHARTGRLVWALNLGLMVGDPIAADVDGDGYSEILVSAADGKLHVIGRSQRRRTVGR